MKTIEQRRKEYLDEKVQFYSEDISRRAVGEGNNCEYLTADGRKCAIGLDMKEDHPEYEEACQYLGNAIQLIITYPNILRESVLELGISFLKKVQVLHDYDTYWEEGGLSEEGKDHYNSIVQVFCAK